MADCSKCVHIDVCGKLIFFGGNCNKECIHYKDSSNLAEIVRCKDCKWIEKGKDYEPYCNHWKSGLYANVKDNDFCSYGERKDNG